MSKVYDREIRLIMPKSSALPFSILCFAGAAMLTIMVYCVMQHHWQREILLQNIKELQRKLGALGQGKPLAMLCEKEILCRNIQNVIGGKINCDQYLAALRLLNHLNKDGKVKHPIGTWNSIPRPFIKLSGKYTVNSVGSDENSRRLYWNIQGSSDCNGIDPTPVGNSTIKINQKGSYYLSSRVHFKCPTGISGPYIHRHTVYMLEDSDEHPYPLMENSYQFCDEPNGDQDSFQGGMYYLFPGSLLYVEVDEPEGDRTYSDDIERNSEFVVYML